MAARITVNAAMPMPNIVQRLLTSRASRSDKVMRARNVVNV